MPSSSTSARPLSARLTGTWELISRKDHTKSGERRIDPSLGADPVALLVYVGLRSRRVG